MNIKAIRMDSFQFPFFIFQEKHEKGKCKGYPAKYDEHYCGIKILLYKLK